jgi:hypothetical protein
LPKPVVAVALKFGDAVWTPDGRIGVLIDLRPAVVRFGADGPDYVYDWKKLKIATREDCETHFPGVGCNQGG